MSQDSFKKYSDWMFAVTATIVTVSFCSVVLASAVSVVKWVLK